MQPNIIYLHSHDTGRYIQPYGYAVPTARMQALAEEGVLFRQAHTPAPTCSPSRAALLTGQCPHRSGMIGLAHCGFVLKDYQQHLNHTLAAAGYTTALAGVQHLARAPFAEPALLGYQHHLTGPDRTDAAHAAAQFLADRPQQPFFLDVGFVDTHRRGGSAGAFVDPKAPGRDGPYVRPPDFLPDTPDTRRDFADFIVSAGNLDKKIGVVLDALAASGLADNTLVICTTDHGIPFPGAKCTLTDAGTGVMLILRGPGGLSGGKVIDAMVSQMDLFPTICDLAGITLPPWLQGTSLLPLVLREVTHLHEGLFGEVTYHAAYEPQRSVRTRQWKYIRRFDDRRHPNLVNIDDGISKTVLVKRGLRDSIVPRESLFDLTFDPGERCNRAADAPYAAVLAELRGRLDRWMQANDDPLLDGPVPAPPGVKVTDGDLYSPHGGDETTAAHSLVDPSP